MKKIYNIFDSFRPTVTIPAALLIHVGYNVIHQKTDWTLVILMFFIAGLTMLQNDYFDRMHDIKKGKDFVFNNQKLATLVLVSGWVSCIVFTILFFWDKSWLLLLVIGVGIFYSFFKNTQLLPLVTVALVSASPILLSGVPHLAFEQIVLFVSIALAILGREILKDVEDADVDIGYKATLLNSVWFSKKQVHIIAGISITFGVGLSVLLLSSLRGISYSCYLAGLSFMTTSVFFVAYLNEATRGKQFFDLGMVSILIAFSI